MFIISEEEKKKKDKTAWKTNLRFIKSTILKGGETRGKDERKLTYYVFFT